MTSASFANRSSTVPPLKVVHVITSLSTGGAEMMLFKVLQQSGANVQHHVISLLDRGTLASQIEAAGIAVTALDIASVLDTPRAILRLVKYLRRARPDIVQAWMYHANFIALVAALFSGLEIPVLWNVRASIPKNGFDLRLRLLLRLSALLSSLATAIVYCSRRAEAQHEAAGFCKERSVYIQNGFDVDRFKPDSDRRRSVRERLKIPADALVVGHVARLHPYKDQACFVKAASLIATTIPRVIFVMAGRDVPNLRRIYPELEPALEQLGTRLCLLPECGKVEQLMHAFDVFVLSSNAGEAFPNVLGEAMACGIPCVTTDVGDAAELVGRSDMVVEPQNPSALAAAVNRSLQQPEPERRSCGETARARIFSDYQIGDVAQQYVQLWRQHVPVRAHHTP